MLRRMMWFGFGFMFVLVIAAGLLWFKRETVESKLLDRLIQKIEPSLPFKIESYHLGRNLESLSINILFQGEHISLDGPLHWQWIKKDGIELRYVPTVEIQGASSFPLTFTVHTERQWTKFEDFQLQIAPTDFTWKKYGVEAKAFSLSGNYDGDALHLETGSATGTWNDPLHSDHAMSLTDFHLTAEIPHLKTPLTLSLSTKAKGAEVLMGSAYLDIPLATLPLELQSDAGKIIDLNLGKDQLSVHAELDARPAEFKTAEVRFRAKPIALPAIMPWVTQNLGSAIPFLKTLSDYQFKKGQFSAEGSGVYHADQKSFSITRIQSKGSDFAFRSAAKKIAVRGFNFDVDYRGKDSKHSARIQAKDLFYRHFSAILKPTTLNWDDQNFWIGTEVPLQIKDIPFTFGKVDASLKPELDLNTSLKLAPVSLETITRGFCFPENKLPPIQVTGDFSNIQVSSSVIDPTGKFNASLFGGNIELNDIGVFDLDTEVPETDFDMDWTGIDLQKMGDWSHFGEIKGTLEGYAHDVVLQELLPTQYHFLLNVSPYDKEHTTARVEFSPEAMKNVVKVFTGTDLDQQIPGIASWLMFGWPSHVFGGYDVYYAGLKLTSEEGHIIVETLDKPGIFEIEQKHFVLYGPRFKMPLRNATYPPVIDATSMSNFVHQLLTQFQTIKQKKEGTTYEETSEIPCDPPEL